MAGEFRVRARHARTFIAGPIFVGPQGGLSRPVIRSVVRRPPARPAPVAGEAEVAPRCGPAPAEVAGGPPAGRPARQTNNSISSRDKWAPG